MTSPSPAGPLRRSRPDAYATALAASSARRTRVAWLAFLAAFVLVALAAAAPSADAADRNFAARFVANDTGDIDIFGNTLMTCPAAASGCAAAQQAGVTTTADSTSQNNAYNMQYVDVDGDSSTFDSSRATVSLPTGSTVLFAGLYWGARTAAGSGGAAAKEVNARNKVKFKVPGATAYTSLTADTLDDGTGGIYQGFDDVTAQVKAAGAGQYTVADVQASTGADTLAGWSLVIAYRDTAQPARNLSVFDGIKSIGSGASGSIAVSGFTTPPAGDVNSTIGFVTYEGDGGIVGDSASLNGRTLSDAQHPATNFFNSRSSRDGVRRTATDPNHPNQLGIEQSMLSVGKPFLGNSDTSATIGLTSSGDVYAPGVVTLATELYAPKIEQTKTVTDVNGGLVEQGDVLEYAITTKNTGQDGATNDVLRDPIPANTTYVPGSITVTNPGSTATAISDTSGNDTGEYDATNGRIVTRLGTGATASAGGTIPAGSGTYTVRFQVKVGSTPAIPSGTIVANTATSSFNSASLGTPLTAESTANATVRSPDLTIVKKASGTLVRGTPGTYTIDVRNIGAAKTQGTVTVKDPLPAGLTAVSAAGTGWSCGVAGGDVTCTRTDALAPAAAYPTITVGVNVTDDVPASVANSATVSGGGDANTTNNSSTDTSIPASVSDLSIVKTVDASPVAVGGDVRFTLKVTNGGPSRSTGATVTDALPTGLAFVSSPDAACAVPSGSTIVTCTVGALNSGASVSYTVVARPVVGTAGSTIRNIARVVAAGGDPNTTNDVSSVDVAIKPVDLAVTNTIQGAPDTLDAGGIYTWLVDVENLGGSPATGSVVTFPVPAGTSVAPTGLDPRCTVVTGVASSVVTCALDTVAPGASAAQLQIPLVVAPGGGAPASVQTVATVKSLEPDAVTSNNTAATNSPVKSAVDLGVTLASNPTSTSAGDTLTLTATVKNAGPATPVDPTVTISIPNGTTFVSAPDGCTPNLAAGTVTCTLSPSDLGPGGTVTKAIVVEVGPTPPDTIDSTATVKTASNDTDPSNDKATLSVPVVKVAGLSITKTASTGQAKPGETVTYALRAANTGVSAAAAQGVVVTDTLPAGVTFVSVDDPACTYAAPSRTVSCDFGTIGAGATRSANVAVTVDPLAGAFDSHAIDQIDVVKVESDLTVQGARTGAATAECAPGFFATDGSVRIDGIDDASATLAGIEVLQSAASADGHAWDGRLENTTAKQVHAKVEVVCLSSQTTSAQHHPLLVSDQQTATRSWNGGSHDVVLTCGTGRVAVAPSFSFSNGSGVVRTSQREGTTGWRFTVDVPESADAILGIRCLSTTTGLVNGHVHDLLLSEMSTVTVTVPAGGTANAPKLTCPNDGKGIVASTDMDPGLLSLGNDPQPVSRVFGFYNPTDEPLTARISLLCIDTHTSGELGVQAVANTASVTTGTADATTTDDSATATFVATPAAGDTGIDTTPVTPAPVTSTPSPRPVAPAVVAPATTAQAPVAAVAKAVVLSSALRVTGTTSRATVAVAVRCSSACAGTAKLVALARVKGSTTLRKGSVLAATSLRLVAGKQGTLRLVAKGKAAKALRLGRVTKASLVITTGKGTQVVRTVRVSAR
ncbi:hypothetical protein AB0L40_01450 [Patulibacter sp. NPDC049589]|uniref:hypothetical protein n=1 Tax=Patulibacter sp. NPDC049589 TaxID=3154731 RepID=UPI003432495E